MFRIEAMNQNNWKCRTELLLGEKKIELLTRAHILVAGLGGVGGYAAEQLCRAGIGNLTIVDYDTVQPSNRNRQIIALKSTEGRDKVKVLSERLKDINPDLNLRELPLFINEENISTLLKEPYDFIVDAIDTLSPKVLLLSTTVEKGFKIVSSMGSGGKTDPSKVKVDDIANSNHCKFAYMVRKYLHRFGIYSGIRVVYSPEPVKKETILETDGSENKHSVVGTISYMPAIFGCHCAAEVIRQLLAASD